jgi:hypothetical protein
MRDRNICARVSMGDPRMLVVTKIHLEVVDTHEGFWSHPETCLGGWMVFDETFPLHGLAKLAIPAHRKRAHSKSNQISSSHL